MKTGHEPRIKCLLEVIGSIGDTWSGLFSLIEIANEEIAAAKSRHPLQEFAIHKAFAILSPELGMFENRNDGLYRAHCRELLDRVAAGASKKDLLLGTKAEVLSILTKWSFEHPPGERAAGLMAALFADVFPKKAELAEGLNEAWAGANDELFGALQRKIASRTNRAKI